MREKGIEVGRALLCSAIVGVEEAVRRPETLRDRELAARVVRWIRRLQQAATGPDVHLR